MNYGTLYLNGEAQSRTYFTKSSQASGRYDIFISHQQKDAVAAVRLARYISRLGIPCYIDILDSDVDGDSPGLEGYLRQVIDHCRGLLAIVSASTKSSWWVPMEIGVALQCGKHIGTYMAELTFLPSYLWQWPVMNTDLEATKWSIAAGKYSSAYTNRAWRRLPRQTAIQRNAFFNIL